MWPGSGFPYEGMRHVPSCYWRHVLCLPVWPARSKEDELRVPRMYVQVHTHGEAVGAPRRSMGDSNLVKHLTRL